jgi:hypothetical protein
MPVLPAIIGFAISEIAGATIAATIAELGITGVAASAASGAVIGGLSGGLGAAVTGGNVGKGIIGGLVSGGVTGGVSNLVGGALSGPSGDIIGPMQPNIGGSTALGAGAVRGLGALTGGTAGALATGQPFGSAIRSGLISGAAGGVSGAAGNYFDLGKIGTGALGGAIGYGLNQSFPGSTQSSRSTIPTQSGVSGFQSPGSPSALGSALFAAPGMSYSPSGPVLGGSGGEDKAPKNVWSETDKSLRDVGSTVT